jgi:murein DD-endopeptidase MepM/ murein hydrolase activator NlpD
MMKLISHKYLALLVLIASQSTFTHAEIYKFQDQNGKWHFSDKKPSSISRSFESLQHKAKVDKKKSPFLETKRANGKIRYIAHNPFLAPVQCFLKDKETKKKISMTVLKPLASETLFEQQNNRLKREVYFSYVMGDPETKPATTSILPPFTDYKPMRISQGFNGKFSHNHHSNRYAVDISMPVGTKITAVKEGLVIRTKDDYALAGVSSPFFFDKANLVEILHDDGTFALYGHLLLGGVQVKVGDSVSAGQVIGLSGNTGYSTGPHLHFVIRYNNKGKTRTVPFTFLQADHKQITPEMGAWLLPYLAK